MLLLLHLLALLCMHSHLCSQGGSLRRESLGLGLFLHMTLHLEKLLLLCLLQPLLFFVLGVLKFLLLLQQSVLEWLLLCQRGRENVGGIDDGSRNGCGQWRLGA